MRQLVIIPTGNEMLMFERAYPKGVELGELNYKFYSSPRTTVVKEAISHRTQLIMPTWRRTINKEDRGTEFSYNYPDAKNRISVAIPNDDYEKLEAFAQKNCLSLVDAIMILIRNYTAILYEEPDVISQPKTIKDKKEDLRKGVLIKLEPEVYDWFTVQAVKKDETTGGFIRRTLERVYQKNIGGE